MYIYHNDFLGTDGLQNTQPHRSNIFKDHISYVISAIADLNNMCFHKKNYEIFLIFFQRS